MAENLQRRLPSSFNRAAECLALVCAFALYATAIVVLHLSISTQIVMTVGFLATSLLLAWRNFNRGMHPVFLFLGLLFLFQAGGLLAFLVSGGKSEPMKIYTAELPFDVPERVQSEALLLLALSAVLVYVIVRLFDTPVHFELPANQGLLPFITAILLLSLPFHFWKNYEYLLYVRSHGGYLAIFRSDEHIEQVGFLVRAMSQVCSSAFVLYFVYARRGWSMLLICSAYFGISIVELMIGLRGRVMLLFICFLFLWKLKQNSGFRFRSLVILVVAFAAVSQLIATFRENKAESASLTDIPQLFLSTQGVSLGVTEAAIAFRSQFAPYKWSYLSHGVAAIFGSEAMPQAMYPQGQVLDVDTTMYLNPTGLALGFGTGGSYLAEGYVFGAALGVILESLLIALALVVIARNLTGWRAPYAWTVMLSVLYLPRANLTTSLSSVVHACVGVFAVFTASVVLQKAADFLHLASPSTDAAERV